MRLFISHGSSYEVQGRVWNRQPVSGFITYVKGLVRRLGLLHIRGHDCGIVEPDGGWRGKVGNGGRWNGGKASRVAAVTEGRV